MSPKCKSLHQLPYMLKCSRQNPFCPIKHVGSRIDQAIRGSQEVTNEKQRNTWCTKCVPAAMGTLSTAFSMVNGAHSPSNCVGCVGCVVSPCKESGLRFVFFIFLVDPQTNQHQYGLRVPFTSGISDFILWIISLYRLCSVEGNSVDP